MDSLSHAAIQELLEERPGEQEVVVVGVINEGRKGMHGGGGSHWCEMHLGWGNPYCTFSLILSILHRRLERDI
jgi:hypothetical protein